jgi:hypothetical protein
VTAGLSDEEIEAIRDGENPRRQGDLGMDFVLCCDCQHDNKVWLATIDALKARLAKAEEPCSYDVTREPDLDDAEVPEDPAG